MPLSPFFWLNLNYSIDSKCAEIVDQRRDFDHEGYYALENTPWRNFRIWNLRGLNHFVQVKDLLAPRRVTSFH